MVDRSPHRQILVPLPSPAALLAALAFLVACAALAVALVALHAARTRCSVPVYPPMIACPANTFTPCGYNGGGTMYRGCVGGPLPYGGVEGVTPGSAGSGTGTGTVLPGVKKTAPPATTVAPAPSVVPPTR
jgi:hypothetical protein